MLWPRQVSTSAAGSTLAKLRLPVIDPLLCECQPFLPSLFLGCKAALNLKLPDLLTRTDGPIYDNVSGPTLAVGTEMSRHALDMMSLVILLHCQPVAVRVILSTLILPPFVSTSQIRLQRLALLYQ